MLLLRPLLALLLSLLVFVQVTDVLPCGDEGGPARTEQATEAPAAPDGAHPKAPAANSAVDCLCHALFAPTAPALAVTTAAAREAGWYVEHPQPPASRSNAPPAPVPLG